MISRHTSIAIVDEAAESSLGKNRNSIAAADPSKSDEHQRSKNDWVVAARFLLVWIYPAALSFYLKWYMMANEQGFVREARSMGMHSLSFTDRLIFFRQDFLLIGLVIPTLLFLAYRYLPTKSKALLSGAVSGLSLLIVAVQLFSLKEVGRFCSWAMLEVGLSWGWHESSSNVTYLWSGPVLLLLLCGAGAAVTMAWAVRNAERPVHAFGKSRWKTTGELYCFGLIAAVLLSLHSDVLKSPYRESALVRSATSFWQGTAIDSKEFYGLHFEAQDRLAVPDFSRSSASDLVKLYRQLSDAPATHPDSGYFGSESGASVLFFILETTPEEYLPVNGDFAQFPNIGRLRQSSFIGERHYTTFPMTRCAIFSMFSSWYPIDEPAFVYGSIQNDRPADFLRLLHSRGYVSAVFSPLKSSGISDDVVFRALGFDQQVYPSSAIANYNQDASWRQERVAADTATLQLLLQHIDQWNSKGQKYVAAFVPQIGHYPYPDESSNNSANGLKQRARAVLAVQDAWLGQILSHLQRDGKLQNTMIVVVGDHGLRTIEENPDLRRGTIDENSFQVPLFIYAPRALHSPREIPWLTSHIDIAPTILDLLGENRSRSVEQGSPIWDPALQNRTTFFFARQMFGADGYYSGGQFYMWHYFSDAVYQNHRDLFQPADIVALQSDVHQQVSSTILKMAGIERSWHPKFDAPAATSNPVESAGVH
jgi:hypothetical protein